MIDDFDNATDALSIFVSLKKSTDLHMAAAGMVSARDSYSSINGMASDRDVSSSTGFCYSIMEPVCAGSWNDQCEKHVDRTEYYFEIIDGLLFGDHGRE